MMALSGKHPYSKGWQYNTYLSPRIALRMNESLAAEVLREAYLYICPFLLSYSQLTVFAYLSPVLLPSPNDFC